MNRLLTTLVQLFIAIPAIYCLRIVFRDATEDWKKLKEW